jgi:hypothetical protein
LYWRPLPIVREPGAQRRNGAARRWNAVRAGKPVPDGPVRVGNRVYPRAGLIAALAAPVLPPLPFPSAAALAALFAVDPASGALVRRADGALVPPDASGRVRVAGAAHPVWRILAALAAHGA